MFFKNKSETSLFGFDAFLKQIRFNVSLTSKAVLKSALPVKGEAKEMQVIGFGIHSFSDPANLKATVELSAAPRLKHDQHQQ